MVNGTGCYMDKGCVLGLQVSEKILASKLQSAESSSVKLEAPKPPRQPKVGSCCSVTVWTDGLTGLLGLLQMAPFPSPHPTPHRPHTLTHTLFTKTTLQWHVHWAQ